MAWKDFLVHAVDVHGWKREGNCVYPPKTCRVCGKTALYKSGVGGYACKEHKDYVQRRRDFFTAQANVKAAAIAQTLESRDREDRSRRKLHDAKKRGPK